VYLHELALQWHTNAGDEARQYEAGASQVSYRGKIAFAGHRPKFSTTTVDEDIGALSFIGFGTQSAVLSDREFRRAVSTSLGRWGMRQIGSGEPIDPTTTVLVPRHRPRRFSLLANTPVATSLFASLASRYSQIEAKKLIVEILVNRSRPDDAVVAARVAAALFLHGVKSKILVLSSDVFARRSQAGQCDLYIGQLASSGGRPVDTLLEAFVVGREAKVAATMASESRPTIERRFAIDLPIVPLFRRGLHLHYRNDLHGLKFSSARTLRFDDLHFAGLPTKN